MNLNLRVSNDLLEILNALNKMYKDQISVLLWQNVGPRRIIRNANIKVIDYASGKIILIPSESNRTFDFEGTYTVYMRGPEKSILFKREMVVIEKKRIVFDIPKEVRMFEKRTTPRLRLGFNSAYMAHLEIKINSTSALKKEFSFNVFDISTTGISFNFNAKDQIYFSEVTEILIHRIGKIPFKNPIEGKVVYLKKIEFINQGNRISKIKMGIKLKYAFSEALLNSFLS